jgi:hypothetical protein
MQSKPSASGRDLVEPVPGARRAIALSHIRPVPRRGLSRVEAALYLGISPSKFDQLRENHQVGPPHILGGRKLWDMRDLDETFDASPLEDDQGDWTVHL